MLTQIAWNQLPESLTRRVLAAGVTTCAGDEGDAGMEASSPAVPGTEPVAVVAGRDSDTGLEAEVSLDKSSMFAFLEGRKAFPSRHNRPDE